MNTRLIKALSFGVIILGFFMALLDTTIVNISIPTITSYYNTTKEVTSWILNGYNLAFAVFIITAARLADQFGRKKIFLIGVFTFTLASLMCGMSNSVNLLIFFRVIQGLAGAIVVPVTVPMVLELFSPKRQGAIMGVWAAISGLAAASGPALGGFLTQNFKWQWIFYVNIPIGIITVIFTMILIKESFDPTAGKKIDLGGVASLSVAMFSLTYALIQANTWGWSSLATLGCFALCVVSFTAFFILESKVKEPMLPLSLLKIIPFTGCSLTLLILGAGMMGSIFMTSFFLTTVMGMDVLKAGLTVASMPLASILTSAIAGPLSSKFGSRLFGVLGMLLIALSVFLLGGLHAESSRMDAVWRLLITGAGMGLTMAPIMGSAIRNTPKDKSGIVSGILNMTRALGTVLGVAILVAILNSSMGHSMITVKEKAIQTVSTDKAIGKGAQQFLIKMINEMGKSKSQTLPDSEVVKAKLNGQAQKVLSQADPKERKIIEAKLKVQNEEIVKLLDKMPVKIKDGMAEAFDKTFKYGSVIVLIGILFALFSDRKRNKDEEERDAVPVVIEGF